MKLLVVDDHPEARQMASRLLLFLGHEVHEAATAQEAEAYLDDPANGVDIVFMDLLLGRNNGLAVAERMEARRPGLRVLFMSGHDESLCDVEALHGRRRGFIGKPFSLDKLAEALASLAAAD